jgi:hypothetical protein
MGCKVDEWQHSQSEVRTAMPMHPMCTKTSYARQQEGEAHTSKRDAVENFADKDRDDAG